MSDANESPAGALIYDLFRRADKNDDNMISESEFQLAFSDGLLSLRELKELFQKIDTDNSGSIEPRELADWFVEGLPAHEGIFLALNALNTAISESALATAKDYPTQDYFAKYRTRFLLREAVAQLEALTQPVERCIEVLEDQARLEADRELPHRPSESHGVSPGASMPVPASVPMSNPSAYVNPGAGVPAQGDVMGELAAQVERMRKLLGNYEAEVKLKLVDEDGADEPDDVIVVVQRQFVAVDGSENDLQAALKQYLQESRTETGVLHCYAKRAQGSTNVFYAFEVHATQDDLDDHYLGDNWRQFARSCVDLLATPMSSKSLGIPVSWWPVDIE